MDLRGVISRLDSIENTTTNTVVSKEAEVLSESVLTKHTISEVLIESFGYHVITEAPEYTTPGGIVIPSGAKTAEAEPKKIPNHAPDVRLAGKFWDGIKKLGKRAALPLIVATEAWNGYEEIKKLPTDLDENQYRAEVTKIVSKLVARFGWFWVGMALGAALFSSATVVTGPGALVAAVGGAIAGGAGGLAAEYMLGDSTDKIVDAIVNRLYHTKNIPAKTAAEPVKPAANNQAADPKAADPTTSTSPTTPVAEPDYGKISDAEKEYWLQKFRDQGINAR